MSDKKAFMRLGDNDLVNLFEETFKSKVADENNISLFRANLNRDVAHGEIEFEVDIYGLAGTPPLEKFKNGAVGASSRSFLLERSDIGRMQVNLMPERTVFLNGNDYRISYRAV